MAQRNKFLDGLKARWDKWPKYKWLVVGVLGYFIYKKWKEKHDEDKAEKAYRERLKSGAGYTNAQNGGILNLEVQAQNLLGCFFDSWDEDEAEAVRLILEVPDLSMPEFNRRYNAICKGKSYGGSWFFWTYSGKNLVADCKYFLEGKMQMVQTKLSKIA